MKKQKAKHNVAKCCFPIENKYIYVFSSNTDFTATEIKIICFIPNIFFSY